MMPSMSQMEWDAYQQRSAWIEEWVPFPDAMTLSQLELKGRGEKTLNWVYFDSIERVPKLTEFNLR